MGQYGRIRKTVVNKDKPFLKVGSTDPTYSAYLTFNDLKEATLAILCLDGLSFQGVSLKVSYGMTKYCSYFIKGQPCPKNACLYLHEANSQLNVPYLVKLLGI